MILPIALAIITATPATMPAAIKAARPGDTIVAAPGTYGDIAINRRNFDPRLTIDLRKARAAVTVTKSEGLTILGGKTTSTADTGGKTYAYSFDFAKRITLKTPTIEGLRHGVQINRSQDILVNGPVLRGLTQDGVTIGLSQRVTVQNFTCADFRPAPGTHPDCVQGWSRPGAITSDIAILRGTISGDMQGAFFGNHVRDGVDDGGFDRVTIRDNRVRTSYPQGIALYDCRGCIVLRNTVETIPGARWRTNLNIVRGSVAASANTVGPKL